MNIPDTGLNRQVRKGITLILFSPQVTLFSKTLGSLDREIRSYSSFGFSTPVNNSKERGFSGPEISLKISVRYVFWVDIT